MAPDCIATQLRIYFVSLRQSYTSMFSVLFHLGRFIPRLVARSWRRTSASASASASPKSFEETSMHSQASHSATMMPSRGLHLAKGIAPRIYQLQCRNVWSFIAKCHQRYLLIEQCSSHPRRDEYLNHHYAHLFHHPHDQDNGRPRSQPSQSPLNRCAMPLLHLNLPI